MASVLQNFMRKLQQLENVTYRFISLGSDFFVTRVVSGNWFDVKKSLFLEWFSYPFTVLSNRIHLFLKLCNAILSLKSSSDAVIKNRAGFFSIRTADDTLTAVSSHYDAAIKKWVKIVPQQIRKSGVFIDIGGNMGQYAIAASRAGYKSVHTFEANPSTAKILSDNLKLNRISNVKLHEVALSNTKSTLHFGIFPDYTGGCKVLTPSEYKRVLSKPAEQEKGIVVKTVSAMPFDTIAKNSNISASKIAFVKMDVEDFEYFVLSGMTKTLPSLNDGTYLMIEIRDQNPYLEKIKKMLAEFGFVVEKTHDDNYLFVKRSLTMSRGKN